MADRSARQRRPSSQPPSRSGSTQPRRQSRSKSSSRRASSGNYRGQRRRRGYGGLFKLLAFVVILTALVAGCLIFFRVNQVVVTGAEKYSAEEIIAASGVEEGENLLLLSKSQIVRVLMKELPYLDQVVIQQKLPDTLSITVTDAVPVAVIYSEGAYWLVDSGGKLLEQITSPSYYPALIQVKGLVLLLPEAGSQMALGADNSLKLSSFEALMAELIARDWLGLVSEMDFTQDIEMSFLYDQRIWIQLLLLEQDLSTKLDGLTLAMDSIQSNEQGTLNLTGDVGERWFFIPD